MRGELGTSERAREALVACGRGELALLDALSAFVDTSGALAAGLTVWRSGAFVKQTWLGLPASFERAYVEQFHAADPWIERVRALSVGSVLVSEDLLPRRQLEAGAFHAELCRPHGIRDIYGSRLARVGPYDVTLGVLRPRDARGEGRREAALVERLLPELGRVADAEVVALRRAIADTSLDGLAFAVFVLMGSRPEVLLANAAGRALVASGMVELLTGDVVVDGESLCGWLGAGGSGRRTTKHRGVRVSAGPARELHGTSVRDLYVHDPVSVNHELAARARRAYGLTERETQIARHLLLGRAPKEIAAANGVSVATLRSQLRQLYAKVGVEGQTQLVGALSCP
ncbi:MAG TPA: helix-turn-helix transcriptional regulator [Polyangiaceae bacterium]|nr:helix-turn-helix transcriptional regulator [Polyangiaceae bacterium]